MKKTYLLEKELSCCERLDLGDDIPDPEDEEEFDEELEDFLLDGDSHTVIECLLSRLRSLDLLVRSFTTDSK